MSSFYLVSSSEGEKPVAYDMTELPAALEQFFGLIDTAEWAELRWSS